METRVNNNGFDYIDFGLPSGTLWATMNVGASKPSDCGLYFQWGDTSGYSVDQIGSGKGKKAFNWSDYKWNPSGNGKTFTKYTTHSATLELEDDAAHVNMGGDWHIPTPDQIKELIDNTTRKWAISNGSNGMIFTSKNDVSKSIFIPAAGYVLDGCIEFIWDDGNIWSSMLSANNIDGKYLGFDLGGTYMDINYRNFGLSVRGVIDGKDEDLTEEILEKNGFKNDGTNVFSYTGKNCAVDVWYCPMAIRNRHWHCAIYIEHNKYLLCSTIIQTIDQFNKLIAIMNIDCNPLKY